jgi:hypothetical protein
MCRPLLWWPLGPVLANKMLSPGRIFNQSGGTLYQRALHNEGAWVILCPLLSCDKHAGNI